MERSWFRFYASALNDPKVQKLSPELFKSWVNLLCIACQQGGDIPGYEDLAFMLRKPEGAVQKDVLRLIDAGLIEEMESESLFRPHNWEGRQFESDVSTDRVKRFRNGKRNVSETPDETPPEQNRTDTEQNRTEDAPEGLDFKAWERWLDYRRKVRKPIKPVSILAAQRELAGYGADQVAVVEQSIAQGWQGLFALKKANGNGKANASAPWWSSPAMIEAKGNELGVNAKPGESMQDYKGRVQVAIDRRTAA